jgi:hypothetical protein
LINLIDSWFDRYDLISSICISIRSNQFDSIDSIWSIDSINSIWSIRSIPFDHSILFAQFGSIPELLVLANRKVTNSKCGVRSCFTERSLDLWKE